VPATEQPGRIGGRPAPVIFGNLRLEIRPGPSPLCKSAATLAGSFRYRGAEPHERLERQHQLLKDGSLGIVVVDIG
jgi:hypothetical protein